VVLDGRRTSRQYVRLARERQLPTTQRDLWRHSCGFLLCELDHYGLRHKAIDTHQGSRLNALDENLTALNAVGKLPKLRRYALRVRNAKSKPIHTRLLEYRLGKFSNINHDGSIKE
jgi:hypothetical protein